MNENLFNAEAYKYIADNTVVEALSSDDLNLMLGVEGDTILVNRLNKDMAHVLIAGGPGSGKTTAIDLMLASLASRHDASELQMILVDYKKYEYVNFKCFRNIAVVDSFNTVDLIKPMKFLQEEIEKRKTLLKQQNVENLSEYNKTVAKSEQLPSLLCVVADLAVVLSFLSKEDLVVFNNAVETISLLGGALGIHLILTIKRPIKISDSFMDNALRVAYPLQPDQYARIFTDFKPKLKTDTGAAQTNSGNFIFNLLKHDCKDEKTLICSIATHMNAKAQDAEILFTFIPDEA